VLRRIFGTRRVEVAGSWRRLYNDELHSLFATPNINRVTKSRRISVRFPGGAGHFFSSPPVQTGSEAHPTSYPKVTGDSFL
jgi:hypothetical protein